MRFLSSDRLQPDIATHFDRGSSTAGPAIRWKPAIELIGSCLMMAVFVVLALFG
jgi:hypothetical protein